MSRQTAATENAKDRDPLAERPIGNDIKLVDRMKDSGLTVNDGEWRLGMLGAIVSGRHHQIGAYAKHLDVRMRSPSRTAPGTAVPRPRTC